MNFWRVVETALVHISKTREGGREKECERASERKPDTWPLAPPCWQAKTHTDMGCLEYFKALSDSATGTPREARP